MTQVTLSGARDWRVLAREKIRHDRLVEVFLQGGAPVIAMAEVAGPGVAEPRGFLRRVEASDPCGGRRGRTGSDA